MHGRARKKVRVRAQRGRRARGAYAPARRPTREQARAKGRELGVSARAPPLQLRHRHERAAARRDASVSSLVKQYLQTLAATEVPNEKPAPELDSLLAEIANRHPGFSCSENLSREALYESRR